MEKKVDTRYWKDKYTTTEVESYLKTALKTKYPTYIKQFPYVGEDGIYIPCEDYVEKGYATSYRCIMTKEMFVEAYNKWIRNSEET